MNTTTAVLVGSASLCVTVLASVFTLWSVDDGSREFRIKDGSSISLDASQRAILVSTNGGPTGDRQVVCVEPSPDALINMTENLVTDSKLGEATSQEIGMLIQKMSQDIGVRTTTIQLLRDTTFRACEAYLNGVINEFEYSLIVNHFDRVMIMLLSLENLLNVDGKPSDANYAAAAEHLSNVAPEVVGFLGTLLREPRLLTSCLAWFSRADKEFKPEKSERHSKLEEYCDATLFSYNTFVDVNKQRVLAKIQLNTSSVTKKSD